MKGWPCGPARPMSPEKVKPTRAKPGRRTGLIGLVSYIAHRDRINYLVLWKEMSGGATNASIAPTAAASSTSPLHNVFVYGSLLADEVVNALLKRMPPYCSAILHGYHRFSIRGRVYPAILPIENKKVTGRVILGVTEAELDVLDTFEDEEYKRNTVEVSLNGDSGKLRTETYVWGEKDDPNLYGEWDFKEWKRLHMKDFLTMTEEFIEDLEQPESKTRVATYEAYYKEQEG